ncbi:MAG: Farnesyl diphosphate synthase [Firmicutes bacterium]|nr:Farnesyl diphosphate synthase [Bacillota bacterium]MBT9152085.1 Farnesyl diphosphate synthase [Bacillota bacterium]MBT9157169.1 Farnesyl diphosphate synthase [Bacillota bacterium]
MKTFDQGYYSLMVNEALLTYLPSEKEFPPTIHAAMHYSVMGGGKRLRPALAIATHEMFGGSARTFLPAAAAIECIHTYSLVHDDLPAMDNDDYRRGRLSCHKVYGEAIAILAGDALLTLAFELMVNRLPEFYSSSKVLQATAEMALAAGTYGLVGGQSVDILSENQELATPLPTLEYIHTHKTGALFAAAVRMGAILAGTVKDELELLTRYATHLGLGFQIRDDILDASGVDSAKGKLTYVSVLGVRGAEEKLRKCHEACYDALKTFGGSHMLRQAADICLTIPK